MLLPCAFSEKGQMAMVKREDISSAVIKRLPRYYRYIGEMLRQGKVRASSAELACEMFTTASQVRQDLNCFGGFGQRGCGYNLDELYRQIGIILGVDKCRRAVLIGAGNLGRAIAIHMDFPSCGMELAGIFDNDENKIGMTVAGVKIRAVSELPQFMREEKPETAILCIPEAAAEECADILAENGIKAFWNFSHYNPSVKHKGILVENVHLGDSLMLLSYGLTNGND